MGTERSRVVRLLYLNMRTYKPVKPRRDSPLNYLVKGEPLARGTPSGYRTLADGRLVGEMYGNSLVKIAA